MRQTSRSCTPCMTMYRVRQFSPKPRTPICYGMAVLVLVAVFTLTTAAGSDERTAPAIRGGVLPTGVPPVIGAWFIRAPALQPDGYRDFLDAVADHSDYSLLTTSLRMHGERQIIDREVHDWFKQAASYAQKRGIGLALELDPRHSIPEFKKQYPAELQERLWLQEVNLGDSGNVTLDVTYRQGHGDAICPVFATAMHLERVYSYIKMAQGIEPESIRDITASCKVLQAAPKGLSVAIACDAETRGRAACVIARAAFDFPDVFGPHLVPFEAETIKQYADVPLAGLMKDEWGFPADPQGNPEKNGYWFSRCQADAYAEATGGRDLVRDALLMWRGQPGREADRQAAINQLMELRRLRCAEIEQAFYRAAKATFGPNAFVGTHATTYPIPDVREFERNGLDWWAATRDYGQTDETTPYCCRTSLAKKFGGPVWYNQWYDPNIAAYERLIWSYALAGGRMNFHPLYPPSESLSGQLPVERAKPLLGGPLLRADCRIRLLNFISRAPLDCPIAVIFGHACAMNWAGPAYDDVGLELTDAFWRAGYYADLIPSSELRDMALRVDDAGEVWFGRQRYVAVALFHPEFEAPETAAFFQKAARSETILYRLGDWTKDFHAKPFDGNAALPSRMQVATDVNACANAIITELRRLGIPPQTPATLTLPKWGTLGRTSAALPSSGNCRLIDGTALLVSGEQDLLGDPIQKTIKIGSHEVTFDAVGVAAVRLDKDGEVEAMAAGGLRSFKADGMLLELPKRADVALWRDDRGRMRGVLQDWTGPVPAALTAISDDWLRLDVPKPYQP